MRSKPSPAVGGLERLARNVGYHSTGQPASAKLRSALLRSAPPSWLITVQATSAHARCQSPRVETYAVWGNELPHAQPVTQMADAGQPPSASVQHRDTWSDVGHVFRY